MFFLRVNSSAFAALIDCIKRQFSNVFKQVVQINIQNKHAQSDKMIFTFHVQYIYHISCYYYIYDINKLPFEACSQDVESRSSDSLHPFPY
jgi:hypothetical protein